MSGGDQKQPDALLEARLEFGRWAVAVVAGAAFATVLTLVTMQRTDQTAERALLLLIVDPRRHYHVSRLMRLFTFAGLFLFVAGFAFFLGTASALAGWIWASFVLLLAVTLADAEIRGKRRKRAKAEGAG